MKTLIVENDYTGRLLLEEFLKKYGPVTFAVNGAEAVKAVEESLANQEHFDLICMDIMMPVMDGLEAIQKIRNLESSHGLTGEKGARILIVTVLSERMNINEAISSLCDGYIIKPVGKTELMGKLYELGFLS